MASFSGYPGSGVLSAPAGPFSLSDTRILLQFFAFVYSFEAKFFVFLRFLVVYSA